jgi:murein DD-endopeptidase MepM/ murein hydrolase activator NlpD
MVLLRIFAAGLTLLVSPHYGFAETHFCAAGVEVELRTTSPTQGELQVVTIRPERPIIEIRGGWAGQKLHFWKQDGVYRTLLGADLSQKTITFPLAVSVVFEDGERIGCSLPIDIQEGDFIVQKLTVEPKFVELSEDDLARSRREAQRQRRVFRSVTPERLWQGEFQQPLEGVEGSGSFGKRRVFNEQPRSPHSGEDYSAPTGTPIHAVQRGRVALADNLFFSGNAVIVDHGLGLYSYYAHMSTMDVKEGDLVEKGAVLGKVGATGRVTGPHLHMTVRLGHARINPHDLMKLNR